jgi:uncharacterized protein involved in exopolysaccharide biosynthesis
MVDVRDVLGTIDGSRKSLLQDQMQRINRNQSHHFKQLSKEQRLVEEELTKTRTRNIALSRLPSIVPSTSLTSTISVVTQFRVGYC